MPTRATNSPAVTRDEIICTPGGLLVRSTVWLLLLRNIARGKHTLIVGPTGSGKTRLAVEAARHLGRPVEVFYFGGVFDPEAAFLGTTALRGGETRFARSRFIEAVETPDCVIVIDEINRVAGLVLNFLLSLLDWQARAAVDLDDGVRRVVALAPGAVVLATANVGAEYVHTDQLDAALLNRFLIARLGFSEKEPELLRALGLTNEDVDELVRVAKAIREASQRGALESTVSTRNLLEAAQLVLDHFEVERAFEAAVSVLDPAAVAALRAVVRAAR